ncbi:MAG: TrmH family RNA methyltransferase [Candidatus Woesearchaeota archaeon]
MDVLLYATENPRNLGSIIRTSVAFNIPKIHLYDANQLLENEECQELINLVCRRDRRNRVEIATVTELEGLLSRYVNKYATVVGNVRRLGDPKDKLYFEEDSLLIFGCESRGLPREISRRNGVEKFVIPIVHPVQCLGLSEAYAIVLFEYLRQHPKTLPGVSPGFAAETET